MELPLGRGIGAPGSTLDEPLCWVEKYPAVWREPKWDLIELARLRWGERLSYAEIASRCGRGIEAVRHQLRIAKVKGLGPEYRSGTASCSRV